VNSRVLFTGTGQRLHAGMYCTDPDLAVSFFEEVVFAYVDV
jgi:hypothetical protein